MNEGRIGTLGVATIIIGSAVVLITALVVYDKPKSQVSAPTVTDTAEPSDVSIVAADSYCDQAVSEARIIVYFTLRNAGSTDQDVDVMARRRYSDGTSNDSVLDMMTVTSPARSTERFYGTFDYNAEDHHLIECYLHFAGDSGNEVRVDVT